jgi:molecular chaperone DnaK
VGRAELVLVPPSSPIIFESCLRDQNMTPIGIDLGTTHLAAAWVDSQGQPRVLYGHDGSALLPATVYFESPDVVQVGRDPLRGEGIEIDRLAIQTKRWLGRPRNYQFHDREYSAVELASLMLRKVISRAKDQLGTEVGPVTLAIPAHFDVAQRAAIHQVAELAGVTLSAIVSEPVAASIAFGSRHVGPRYGDLAEGVPTLVIDMGGGTLDISVVTCMEDDIDVSVVAGDAHLGGMDFDRALYYHLCHHVLDHTGIDPASDPVLRYRLLSLSRWAKENLTFNSEVRVEISDEFLGGMSCEPMLLTVDAANELWAELLERSESVLLRVLSECEDKEIDLGRVVFSGGGSLVPAFRDRLVPHVAPLAAEADMLMGPDEAVAVGAALYGSMVSGSAADNVIPTLHERLPYDLGVADEVGHMVVVVAKGTELPGRGVHVFTTVEDNQTQVVFRIVRRDADGTLTPLGEVCLNGLNPSTQGDPDLNVHFRVDAEGALSIDAWEGENTPVSLNLAFSGDLTALQPARRGRQLTVL